MSDEVLEKEINQLDKVDESVTNAIQSMGFLWKKTTEKFVSDDHCFICHGNVSSSKYSIITVPEDRVDKGMIAFVSVCENCAR